MSRKLKIRWSSLAWKTTTTNELARRLKCAPSTVWNKRRLFAPGTEHPTGATARKVDFSKVRDWKRRNSVIAAEVGCSESSVAKEREARCLPRQPRKPGSGRTRLIDYSLYNPKKSREENAKLMGCAPAYVPQIARRLRAAKPL
jgi:hypothetical protein